MQPELFSIGNIGVNSIWVFTLLGFLVFTYFFYSNLKKINASQLAFDVVVFTALYSLVLGRVVYVLKTLLEGERYDWTILPVTENIEGIEWFQSMPWTTIAVWDSRLNYGLVVFALILSLLTWLYFEKYKNRTYILISAWKSIIPALIVITFGYLLDGSYIGVSSDLPFSVVYLYDNVSRFAVQVVEVLALMIFFTLYIDTSTDKLKKIQLVAFPVLWFTTKILIGFQTEFRTKVIWEFDTLQLVWLVGGFFYISYFVLTYILRPGADTSSSSRDRKSAVGTEPNYSLSFAKYKDRNPVKYSTREKLEQTKNRLKRKAS